MFSGSIITVTPKDGAAWDSKGRLGIANVGEIGYTIYMRANALYSFAQKPENQEIFGIYPYEDGSDVGGYFADIYHKFEDSYTLDKGMKNGWVFEGNGYAYYVDEEKLYGVQKVDGYYYDFGEDGINVGQTKFTGVFKETGGQRFVRNGELVTTGWNTFDDVAYHCHEDGYAHVANVKDSSSCTKGGRLTYTCTTCGKKETVGNYVMPNGHDWDEDHVCRICGIAGMDIADVEIGFGSIDKPVASNPIPRYYYQASGVRPRFYATMNGRTNLTYSGDATLNDDGTMRDLYITWENYKGIGTARIHITGKGDYYGSHTLTYHIIPNNVTNLAVTAVTDDSMTLTWSAAAGAGYYNLYFYKNGTRELIDEVKGTSYTVTGLEKGETYSFQVRAAAISTDGENKVYESNLSNTVTAKTGGSVPDDGGNSGGSVPDDGGNSGGSGGSGGAGGGGGIAPGGGGGGGAAVGGPAVGPETDAPIVSTETVTNKDGSTTVTETKQDGTVIETVIKTDGSSSTTTSKTEVKETSTSTTTTTTSSNTTVKADGTITKSETVKEKVETASGTTTTTNTTTTEADGTTIKSETVEQTKTDKATGKEVTTSTTETKSSDGSKSTTQVDETGKVEVKVTVSSDAVKNAEKTETAVTLPMPEVTASTSTATAPTVTVNVPNSGASVEIPVENMTSGTVVVIVNPDGSEEIVKTSTVSESGVQVTLEEDAVVKVIDNAKAFDDVHPVDHWAEESIDFVVSRELFTGKTENTFAPNEGTTRGQLMTVLARMDDADTSGSPIQKGMAWAVQKGISDGTNAGNNITRQQLAVMLWRYAGEPESNHSVAHHTDAHMITDYAETAMAWAIEQGILTGYADGSLKPHANATRAHVATMMSRFVKYLA